MQGLGGLRFRARRVFGLGFMVQGYGFRTQGGAERLIPKP